MSGNERKDGDMSAGWKYLEKSHWGGPCVRCGVYVPAGSEVYWLRRVGVKHPACYELDAAGSAAAGSPPGTGETQGNPPEGSEATESSSDETQDAQDGSGLPAQQEGSEAVPSDEQGNPSQSQEDQGANEQAQQQQEAAEASDTAEEGSEGSQDESEPQEASDCPYSRPNSKQAILWRHYDTGGDPTTARRDFGPLVEQQIAPWVFTAQTGKGYREPDTMPNQRTKFVRVVEDTYREWLKKNEPRPASAPSAQSDTDERKDPDADAKAAEEIKEEVEDLPKGDDRRALVLEFVKEARRIRDTLDARALHEANVDAVSMRAVLDGVRGIIVSRIPGNALLSAIGLHWSPELRSDMGLPTFDVNTYKQEDRRPGEHPAMPMVRDLAAARIPVMIVGGFGLGKSHLAKQLATSLGLPFGEVNLSGGISITHLFGSETRKGYVSRPLVDLYRATMPDGVTPATGGVFCFEEMDAADPNTLLSVNTAIANGRLQNPINGELIYKHDDFIPVACTNTYGTGGASRFYTGREKLDMATIDRFRMGRVAFKFDTRLEDEIIDGLLTEAGI